jgi:hypothetical protein
MDIMALGFVVFEIANDMISFWKSQTTSITTDKAILEALACLQDEDVHRRLGLGLVRVKVKVRDRVRFF